MPAHLLPNVSVLYFYLHLCIDAAIKRGGSGRGGSDDRHFGPVSDLQC